MRSLRDISSDPDLDAVAGKYDLTSEVVKETVERSISDTLSHIFGSDIECLLNGKDFEIYIFREDEVEKLPVERLKKNILRAIKYDIVSALHREYAACSYEKLRFLTGTIAGGYIVRIFDDCIYAELNAGSGPVVGICDRQHQTPKERGSYRLGDYYRFYVSHVAPVVTGGVPGVKVSLNRTSGSLTAGLMKKELADRLLDIRVKCIGRTAGVYSLIETQERVPSECIKAVSDELKERIKIRVIQKK